MHQRAPLPPTGTTAPAAADGNGPACGHAHQAPAPELSSQDVLCGHPAVAIRHNGALYRLQTTRQGKLILTK